MLCLECLLGDLSGFGVRQTDERVPGQPGRAVTCATKQDTVDENRLVGGETVPGEWGSGESAAVRLGLRRLVDGTVEEEKLRPGSTEGGHTAARVAAWSRWSTGPPSRPKKPI